MDGWTDTDRQPDRQTRRQAGHLHYRLSLPSVWAGTQDSVHRRLPGCSVSSAQSTSQASAVSRLAIWSMQSHGRVLHQPTERHGIRRACNNDKQTKLKPTFLLGSRPSDFHLSNSFSNMLRFCRAYASFCSSHLFSDIFDSPTCGRSFIGFSIWSKQRRSYASTIESYNFRKLSIPSAVNLPSGHLQYMPLFGQVLCCTANTEHMQCQTACCNSMQS